MLTTDVSAAIYLLTSNAADERGTLYLLLVNSGWRRSIVVRTLVSAGELSLSCASWMCDYLAVKPSAIGQPTWPTQPSIPQGSVNE